MGGGGGGGEGGYPWGRDPSALKEEGQPYIFIVLEGCAHLLIGRCQCFAVTTPYLREDGLF